MNKDIIYIDTEDDITSVIGKIKASREKIVALVPPKRTGILQSAVNLRLLARTAKNGSKHLVIISNDRALIALTAIAKIPVAKNLQSKPEIAEIAALDIDDGDDVIEGAQLPVGELAKTADLPNEDEIVEDIGSINIDNEGSRPVGISSKNTSDREKPKPLDASTRDKIKVPDFSKFRKKLVIGIAGGIVLITFLVWAIWFSPAATVVINAKTGPAPVSIALKLGGTTPTDISKGIVQTITKQQKKDVSVDFTATGQKNLGEKATGSITIRNCDYSSGFTLPVGTEFANGDDQVYVSTAAVSVPGYSGLPSACNLSGAASGKATVQVQALESGDAYNNSGDQYSISLIPAAAEVDATGTAMAGGSTRIATVVTADDIEKANQALIELSTDSIKQQLTKQFINGETVIADSLTIERATAVSVPAVGAEATTGKAKLTSATTFSLTAIAKSELQLYLKDAIGKQIKDAKTQRIYEDGIDSVKVSGYTNNDSGATVNIATTGLIGPNVDSDSVKNQVKGKHYGDVQSLLESIEGVSSVDVKFSYFWVRTVPNNVDKIDVKFNLSDD